MSTMVKTVKAGSSWFSFQVKRHEPKLRLFCFPFAGGGVSSFNGWKNAIPAQAELAVLELPGRGRRFSEALVDNMSIIVNEAADEFVKYTDIPYVFFGHSLGALIAVELLQVLRKRSAPMPLFFISSGMRAPQFPARQRLHLLNDDNFLKELKLYNGTPAELLENPELMSLFLPVLRADFSLSENYHYQESPPFNFPLYLMGGDKDCGISQEELDGWKSHTNSHFSQQFFPGDHFYLQNVSKDVLLENIFRLMRSALPEVSISESFAFS